MNLFDSLKAILTIAYKEFVHVWRDRRVLLLILVLPPFFTLVFGHAFEGTAVRDVSTMFLDADKEPLPTYFEWALRLVRPGGLIIGDNALWGGRAYDRGEPDDKTRGVREFNRRMATDPRVLGIIVPTHDGVAIAVVR